MDARVCGAGFSVRTPKMTKLAPHAPSDKVDLYEKLVATFPDS